MYCKNCGKYNVGNVEQCKYCGCMDLTHNPPYKNRNSSYQANSKKNIGILMSIFLGLIGLVIGLLIYVDGDERSTFISGWLKGLWISIGIAVVIVGIVSCSTCSLLGQYY